MEVVTEVPATPVFFLAGGTGISAERALRFPVGIRTRPHKHPARPSLVRILKGPTAMTTNVRWFRELGLDDVDSVGGKNASLGEMVQDLSAAGVSVPDAFPATADAYRVFLGDTGLADRISALLDSTDVDDVRRLADAGRENREAVEAQAFPPDVERDIRSADEQPVADAGDEVTWAVRSSATAEDLPDAVVDTWLRLAARS